MLDVAEKYLKEENIQERSTNEAKEIIRRYKPNEFVKKLKKLSEKDKIEDPQSFYEIMGQKIGKTSVYDIMSSRFRKVIEWSLNEILELLGRGEIVVDVGGGTALYTALFAEKVKDEGFVVDIDISRKMLERGKERVKRRHIENIDFIKADRDFLPLRNNGATSLTCINSLTDGEEFVGRSAYISYGQTIYGRLKEFNRVLKKGPGIRGRVIIASDMDVSNMGLEYIGIMEHKEKKNINSRLASAGFNNIYHSDKYFVIKEGANVYRIFAIGTVKKD